MIYQTRLERFFIVPYSYTPSKLSLTDLPPSIRFQIYSNISLTRDGHIHLNVQRFDKNCDYKPRPVSICHCVRCQERNKSCSYNSWSRISPSSSFLSLLLTCRTVYLEIIPILYSSNHFTISRHGPGGLLGLFTLRGLALASLKSLTIVLNECEVYDSDDPECRMMFLECEDCAGSEKVECDDDSETTSEKDIESSSIASGEPLGCVFSHDKRIILEWTRLCKHIACYIPPNRLRLCLVADVCNVETAQEIIKPMRQLPTLSACSICLSPDTDNNLRCMAINATRELTGRYPTQPPSPRLPRLPHEIQTQILQHTDLVAPHDLRWVPEQGFICLSQTPDERDSPWAQNPNVLNPCELCLGVHTPDDSFEKLSPNTARASQCWCWRFPVELFLVNSAYHREATRIFYSSNHFYIYGDTGESWNDRDICPRFMQRLPRGARQYLRSLQFLLPEFRMWSERDWEDEVLMLSRSVELSRLTVTIDESLWREGGDEDEWSPEEIEKSALKRIQSIVKPFKKLRGLKDFFVHLGYPINDRNKRGLRSKGERLLERRVMGSDYDSEERGKYLLRHRFYDPPPN